MWMGPAWSGLLTILTSTHFPCSAPTERNWCGPPTAMAPLRTRQIFLLQIGSNKRIAEIAAIARDPVISRTIQPRVIPNGRKASARSHQRASRTEGSAPPKFPESEGRATVITYVQALKHQRRTSQ